MAGMRSRMNQSNREQVISSDLNRIGKLANKEAQDAEASRAVRPDFYDPSSNAFDDFSASARATNAVPISGVTKPPSLDAIASSFSMDLGAGEGELYVAGTPAADESTYQLLRWLDQTVSLATPDPSHPQICTIYATPTDALTDLQSRNILTDPATRTTVPANVYKTSNPVATIGVAIGAAAVVPTPPAVPAGSLGLIDVYQPTGASDSTTFIPTRRSQRLIEFPGSSQHGILKGCVPIWGYADEATGATPQIDANTAVNRLVIDGELITFHRTGATSIATPDTSHAPGAAPAGNDLPTYLYICGGRNFPVGGNPYVLVESTTVPDAMGYPTTTLAYNSRTIPRTAALYIGAAFKVAGSTRSKSLFYDGDWVYPQASTITTLCGFHINTDDEFSGSASGSVAPVSLVVYGIPATSTAIELQVWIDGIASTYPQTVTIFNGVGGTEVIKVSIPGAAATATVGVAQSSRTRIARPGSDTIQYTSVYHTSASDATVDIRATAYNMNIPRIGR
jgi:hypothetical protein